ncbi:MAG: HEPN domain-containing protein [Micropruina sp.]|nr:MAG: HEPN domain-containing protein [Micropruina sp.]
MSEADATVEDLESEVGDDHLAEDVDFTTRVLSSLREAFWEPEIIRRGGEEAVGPVHRALAIMYPGRPVEVLLNSEFQLMARARRTAETEPGSPVTVNNLDALEALEPVGVDPDAGWVVWVLLPDGREMAQFDFVRNRARSLRLLSLARQYLDTAEDALRAGRVGPALENAMAAAELAITARIFSFTTDQPTEGGRRNAHSARKHWTKVHVGLGNTTTDAHDTLVALHDLRGASRYGEGEVGGHSKAGALVDSVKRLVDDVELRVGKPLRTQDPDFIARLAAAPRE